MDIKLLDLYTLTVIILDIGISLKSPVHVANQRAHVGLMCVTIGWYHC